MRDVKRLLVPACVIVAIGTVLGGIKLVHHHRIGVDFDVYKAAGAAVLHGKSVFSSWMATQMPMSLPFTYPPLAAILAVPFALIGRRAGFPAWNIFSVGVLVLVIRSAARPLLQRVRHPAIALSVLTLVALALTPVQDELGFGQVGIVLMGMCFFDCGLERPPWPRGAVVGVATAIKLLPGIFIPYLWLSGRRRAALVSGATAGIMTLAGFVVTPHDSASFWTSRVFDASRVGSNAYFSNQALNGILRRMLGIHAQRLWLVLALAVIVVGLRAAARAACSGDQPLGICLTALTGIVASPVSWLHHLVWIVPVLLVLLGDATDRRRVRVACIIALLFALRLPYIGHSFDAGWKYAWLAGPLKDSYGVVCIALLLAMPQLVARTRRNAEIST